MQNSNFNSIPNKKFKLYLGLFIDGTQDIIDNYEEVVDPDYNTTDSK